MIYIYILVPIYISASLPVPTKATQPSRTFRAGASSTVQVGYNNYTGPQLFCYYIHMSLVRSNDFETHKCPYTQRWLLLPN